MDDDVWVDVIKLSEFFFEAGAAFGVFPPFEIFAKGLAGDGHGVEVEFSGFAEVEHDFGDAAGEEDLHGGEVSGSIGEVVDETGDVGIEATPVIDGGSF